MRLELDFRRHHRADAVAGVEFGDAAQHRARGEVDEAAVGEMAVADHLRRRFVIPGHEAQRGEIGHAADVAVERVDDLLLSTALSPVTA